jgi:hypothetical protein
MTRENPFKLARFSGIGRGTALEKGIRDRGGSPGCAHQAGAGIKHPG